MSTIIVKGVIFTGEGIGSQFVEIAWARKQIKEKLGFDPYLGTLNVNLSDKEAKLFKRILKDLESIRITPAEGFFRAHCFEAMIMNKVKGGIVIPEKPGYPSNVLEVIAPVYLRKALSLKDGDEVEVAIFSNNNIRA